MWPTIRMVTATTLCVSMKNFGYRDCGGMGSVSSAWARTSWATTWITPVAITIGRPMRSMGRSGCMSGGLRLAQKMVGDDALLDLRRALEDLGEPRIAPVALDGVQRCVARAAEDLQGLGGDALGHLRGEELHHRRLLVAAPPLVDLVAHEIKELARRLDLGRHAGEPEARVLEVGNGLAELAPLLGIGGGVFECAARQPDRPRGGVSAGALQAGRDVVEGAAFLADQRRARQPAVVEGELPGLPAEIADLGNRRALHARRQRTSGLLDQEGGEADMLAPGIGRVRRAGHQHDVVGAVGE